MEYYEPFWPRSPRSSSWRCWDIVDCDEPPHIMCTECRQRFETLTEFEQHIRRQEMAAATRAEGEAVVRRRREAEKAAKARQFALGIT